jgi:hypothetical protein
MNSRPSGKPTVVDLFAGCGGLSLGLERAGFRPLFVSELSPDAMATYLLNRLRQHPHLARNRAFDVQALTRSRPALDGLVEHLRAECAFDCPTETQGEQLGRCTALPAARSISPVYGSAVLALIALDTSFADCA